MDLSGDGSRWEGWNSRILVAVNVHRPQFVHEETLQLPCLSSPCELRSPSRMWSRVTRLYRSERCCRLNLSGYSDMVSLTGPDLQGAGLRLRPWFHGRASKLCFDCNTSSITACSVNNVHVVHVDLLDIHDLRIQTRLSLITSV